MALNLNDRVALANVIDTWERNITAKLPYVEARACDLYLCSRHYGVKFGDEPCETCPIFKATGVSTCQSSPWGHAYGSYLSWQRHEDEQIGADAEKNFRREAKEYVAWLKDIRDQLTTKEPA